MIDKVRGVQTPRGDVSTYERLTMQCQYCHSLKVRWFTPRRYAANAAVLLCMGCRRLTIVPPRMVREMSHDQQRAA
jgi:hypothetical protein